SVSSGLMVLPSLILPKLLGGRPAGHDIILKTAQLNGCAHGLYLDGLAVVHPLHLGLPVKQIYNTTLVIGDVEHHPVGAGVQPVANLTEQLVQSLTGLSGNRYN